MSDDPPSRRGTRVRKQVEPFRSDAAGMKRSRGGKAKETGSGKAGGKGKGQGKGKGKGKAREEEEQDDEEVESEDGQEAADSGLEEDEIDHDAEDSDLTEPESEDDDFAAPPAKKQRANNGAGRGRAAPAAGTANGAGGDVTGKGRGKGKGKAANGTPAARKAPAGRGKGRASVGPGADGHEGIKDDNGLFNALLQPNIALDQMVEEWVDHFQRTGDGPEGIEMEKESVREMVEFVVRCCGLNNDISVDEADDLDGVPDMLDNMYILMQEDKSTGPLYPLANKSKLFKPFRAQLIQLIHSLLTHISTTPLLFITTDGAPPPAGPSTPLIHVLLTWLHPMTSSPYRAIRHTATLIVLAIGTALCGVTQAIGRELAGADKQREAEERKAPGKAREKRIGDIEARVQESARKKAVVEEYLKDIFDGVFVHRYRDSDPVIRTDCLCQLGLFMEKYPDKFVATKYLHYVDWALCDSDKDARTEAVKMLIPIYRKNTHISHIRAFTARATVRLMEMAARDVDSAIRVHAIHVLSAMNKIGLLADMAKGEDNRRDKLGWLIYDRDVKVRRAVAGFVKGLWDDEVKEVQRAAEEREDERRGAAKFKSAGKGKRRKVANGRAAARDDSDEEPMDVEGNEEQYMGLKALVEMLSRYSAGLAAVDAGQNGEPESLGEDSQGVRAKQSRELLVSLRSASLAAENHAWIAVDALWSELPLLQDWQILIKYLSLDHSSETVESQVWALQEEEETLAIEILLSVLRKIDDLIKGKKFDDEDIQADVTRTLIKVLPRLLAKHQTDTARTKDVLRLVRAMKLDMYMELRMVKAYEKLWEDVTKQFFKHSDNLLTEEANKTIQALCDTDALKTTNDAKLADFDEQLFSGLRDITAGVDITATTFNEEDLSSLKAALLRIKVVLAARDVGALMEDDADGKQSKAWEIVLALADRGRLGFQEETEVVVEAMLILNSTLLWSVVRSASTESEPAALELIQTRRDELLAVVQEFAVGRSSNPQEAIRQQALSILVMLHIALKPRVDPKLANSATLDESLCITMDDSLQFKIVGAVQAVIEKRTEELEENGGDEESDDDDDEDPEDGRSRRKLGRRAVGAKQVGSEVKFQSFIMLFVTALRSGVLDAQHSATFLAHFGYLGPSYDVCLRDLTWILQDEGIYNNEADMVQSVVAQALQDSFTTYLDDLDAQGDPTQTYKLAKVLQPTFAVNGSHFRTERKLASHSVCDFHTSSVSWVFEKMARYIHSEKSSKEKRVKERSKRKAGACLTYFKVLHMLTPALIGRDALKVKKHIEAVCKEHDVHPGGSRTWDPLTAYEKRLVSLASGDPSVKAASRKQADDDIMDAASDEDEDEVDDVIESLRAETPAPRPQAAKQRPKPRPRRAQPAQAAAERDASPQAEPAAAEDEEDAAEDEAAEVPMDALELNGTEDVNMEAEPDVPAQENDDLESEASYSRFRQKKRPKRG